MQCLKCGREISNRQVFCDTCLEDMKKYPVKPGTAVYLPPQTREVQPKKQAARRRPVLPEPEQIKKLHKRIRRMTAAIVLLAILLCAAIAVAVLGLQETVEKFSPGQNYFSVVSEPTEDK